MQDAQDLLAAEVQVVGIVQDGHYAFTTYSVSGSGTPGTLVTSVQVRVGRSDVASATWTTGWFRRPALPDPAGRSRQA